MQFLFHLFLVKVKKQPRTVIKEATGKSPGPSTQGWLHGQDSQ